MGIPIKIDCPSPISATAISPFWGSWFKIASTILFVMVSGSPAFFPIDLTRSMVFLMASGQSADRGFLSVRNRIICFVGNLSVIGALLFFITFAFGADRPFLNLSPQPITLYPHESYTHHNQYQYLEEYMDRMALLP